VSKISFRVSPMLATLVKEPFDRPSWIYEEKYDGVRMLAYKESAKVSLISRNAIDRTERYPGIADEISKLRPDTLVLDGEIVVFDKRKVSHFQLLQQSKGPAAYVVFDCLYLDGKDLRRAPLRERRATLEKSLKGYTGNLLVLSEKLAANGLDAFRMARKRHLEGLVAKNLESKYLERRSLDWLKVKVNHESEFVIGGYTQPDGSRQYFGALLLGVYDGKKLRYAGKVGTGFDVKTLYDLFTRFRKLKQGESPFADEVREPMAAFVKPALVAQVSYTEWTKDGKLRHPAFLGLRDDKSAKDVHREEG
jgi:bifunctional non-homologous end joining protein LigD